MIACLLLASALSAPPVEAADANRYLYRTTLVQAAPGRLLDLIDLYKAGWPGTKDSGDEPPLAMRHSQGDRWDLLLLFPMGSWGEYYSADRVARRRKAREAATADLGRLSDDTAWTEDVFVTGPPLEIVRGQAAGAGFFHVEMFEALPGKLPGLYRQREMENAYLRALALPQNLIFVRESGAAWDLFTIGAYRDLKHYAANADVPEAKQEEAARAAGFDGVKAIGPYLRTFRRSHRSAFQEE
jgi:hypothetical protein